jgi:DNA-binding PadR family transcriptional regulator
VGDRIDHGNLYRLLRGLEEDGLVSSQWRDNLPGRSKRTYQLTDEGKLVLAEWSKALKRTSRDISAFLKHYAKK